MTSAFWPLALLCVPLPQSGDETVVTARKLEERASDVPLSLAVFEARALEEAHLATLRDAGARVPNVFFSEFSARRLSFPFVRGVGSGLGDPAVITYVDDVPQFGFGGTNPALVGVQRIEFLRGPQGTLYGKNALGGLIHVHGRRPASTGRVEFATGVASYDARESSLAFSGPLGANTGLDLALLEATRDGYTKNLQSGHDVDERDALTGRARFVLATGTNSELDVSLFGERARDGGFALSFLEDFPALGVTGLRERAHRVSYDFEGATERDVLNPALVWRVLGDELDFTSVSSFESWDVLETSDFDFSPAPIVTRRTDEEQRYLYQELRLSSPAEEARARVRWVAGFSGFLANGERAATNVFGAASPNPFPAGSVDDARGDFDDLGLGLFGQLTVPLGTLELTGGLRYDRERREITSVHSSPIVNAAIDERATFAELLPSASVATRLGEQGLVYLRAARGFKAGGFNLTAPAGLESFDAEENWSYEIGLRQEFGAGRAELGAALFWIDWEEMQLSQFDPFAGGYVVNAGESRSRGIELEGRGELGAGFSAEGALGFLDTELESFVDSFGTDTSGNDLPQAPDTTLAFGLQYERDLARGHWYVRGDYQSVSDFSYDAGNRDGDSFDIVNLSLGARYGNFGATLWVQNLFDEEYVPIAFQPDPTNPAVFVGENGAPRVLGFTLSAHF